MITAILVIVLLFLGATGVIPMVVAAPTALLCAVMSVSGALLMQRYLQRIPRQNGTELMIGQLAPALTDIESDGQIKFGNELWSARTSGPRICRGTQVRILRVAGLRTLVEAVGSDSLS